jgi:hypothetical protein
MQHGLLAYPDAIPAGFGSDPELMSEPDLIRPGVNLWHPVNAQEQEHELVYYQREPHVVIPHVVLEIDTTKLQPGLLKNMGEIALAGIWWRYFADIPISAISVSERQLRGHIPDPWLDSLKKYHVTLQ